MTEADWQRQPCGRRSGRCCNWHLVDLKPLCPILSFDLRVTVVTTMSVKESEDVNGNGTVLDSATTMRNNAANIVRITLGLKMFLTG
jgi:hypothetical protein